jgi:endonuclease/exonuclease/phosphatase family metal-dependent hydrolase
MRAFILTVVMTLAVALAMASALAADLKVATWNLNWLTLREPGTPGLPADLTPRSPEDLDRLRAYAAELDADVIAIQEVDGPGAARRVFTTDHYVLHISHDRLTQRVGLAVRRGLRHDRNPDVPLPAASEPDARLRSAVDVTLRPGSIPLRVLAVHLKQGCMNPRFDRRGGRDCRLLNEQAAPLSAWIAEREGDGVGYVVLGDFNRWMDRRDPFIDRLRRTAPLIRATEGFASRCWRDEAFIDHILIGGPARAWLQPDSLRVFRYRETGDGWSARLSDHCPVSVRLSLPQPPADPATDRAGGQ